MVVDGPVRSSEHPTGGAVKTLARMCLNWKSIVALSVTGGVIWLVAPNLVASAIPLLVLAVCPVSMLLMMRAMEGAHATERRPSLAEADRPLSRDEEFAELHLLRSRVDDRIADLERGIQRSGRIRRNGQLTTGGTPAVDEPDAPPTGHPTIGDRGPTAGEEITSWSPAAASSRTDNEPVRQLRNGHGEDEDQQEH
jgi:hypothetical protein